MVFKDFLAESLWVCVSQGHYRFCEALFNLEEHRRALDSNILAQSLCREDTDGMRDLQQQYAKFSIEIEEIKGKLTDYLGQMTDATIWCLWTNAYQQMPIFAVGVLFTVACLICVTKELLLTELHAIVALDGHV